ncbi:MAG: hypothetical protein NVS4B13_09850 [Candidatus Elarobacter sp.]
MIRTALAVSVLALAAAHAAAPHATPHRKPAPAQPLRVLHAQVLSGSPQTAHAYVEPADKKYVTAFAQFLTVRIDGVTSKEHRLVRFRCVSKGCEFSPADQPNDGKDIEKAGDGSYKVTVIDGKASLGVAIESGVPVRTCTVVAEPIVRKNERAIAASFVLNTR